MITHPKYVKFCNNLTKRQLEILECMFTYNNCKRCAEKLFISTGTVTKHLSDIYEVTDIKSKKELLANYPKMLQYIEQLKTFSEIELNLNNQLNLEWNNENMFDQFIIDYSNIIESMHSADFSKRLKITNNKNSLANFIYAGINQVNAELEANYLDVDTITKLLKSLGLKNRIILISTDNSKISHTFNSLIRGTVFNPNELIGLEINEIVEFDYKKELSSFNKIERTGQLNPKLFSKSRNNEARIIIEKFEKYTMVSITMYPENRLEMQTPRILQLLSCLKSHYEDSSSWTKTVMGNTIALEVNSVYNELLDLMESQQSNLDTY